MSRSAVARDPSIRPIWFTSDLHFYHKRICELSGRPFASYDEMHEVLIERWNARVALGDEVFVVGDFSLASEKRTADALARLNGEKFLVRGNHDRFSGLFEWEKDLYTVKVKDRSAPHSVQRIVLCHFPMLIWDQRHEGAWHLHGHSHGNLPPDGDALRLDVGVDVHGYAPVSYDEVRAVMRLKSCWPVSKPLDHHGRARNDESPATRPVKATRGA